jgi:hypothetical protein
MKNSDLWDSYVEYTKILSENARSLGFAAGAVCWFFKAENNTFPPTILWALLMVVGFFICDMLQYAVGAVLLRVWTRNEEVKKHKDTGTIEGEYDKPVWLDRPGYILWWTKIVLLFASFVITGSFLICMQL